MAMQWQWQCNGSGNSNAMAMATVKVTIPKTETVTITVTSTITETVTIKVTLAMTIKVMILTEERARSRKTAHLFLSYLPSRCLPQVAVHSKAAVGQIFSRAFLTMRLKYFPNGFPTSRRNSAKKKMICGKYGSLFI